MTKSRRHFVATLTAGVTGALAGCGGSDSATSTAESTDEPTATETAPSTAPETATPTATEADVSDVPIAPPGEAAQVVTVAPDSSFTFSPASFTISAGQRVQWEWAGSGHNVKADTTPSGSDWAGTPGSDTYASGHTYSYTFETPGEYSYYCAPHRGAGMTGSFTVE